MRRADRGDGGDPGSPSAGVGQPQGQPRPAASDAKPVQARHVAALVGILVLFASVHLGWPLQLELPANWDSWVAAGDFGGFAGGPPVETGVIWILTAGSRGDHDPAAALALGLMERGHKVKVFGQTRQKELFAGFGVNYSALDEPVILHRGGRFFSYVERAAAAHGFEGPTKEEDFIFDVWFMWYENYFKTMKKLFNEGKDVGTVAASTAPIMNSLRDFLVLGKQVNGIGVVIRRAVPMLAAMAGKSQQEYVPLARKQRAALLKFLRGFAGEYWDAMDAMRCLNWAFEDHLSSTLKALGTDTERRDATNKLVDEFYAWQRVDLDDLDSFIPGWFEKTCRGLPPLKSADAVGSAVAEVGATGLQNMAFTYAATPRDERPQLIISHQLVRPAARVLQKAHGTPFIIWFSTPPIQTTKELADAFRVRVLVHEPEFAADLCPSRKDGPWPFLDQLKTDRQLVSISSLVAQDAGPYFKEAKEACTGKWVLDDTKGSTFGTSEEQAALEAFISQAEDAPVYMGWGSMVHPRGAKELARLVVQSLKRAGRRGVFVVSWSGVTAAMLQEALTEAYGSGPEAEGRVHLMASAPHERLFPKCAAVVQHGGAGTVQAAMRSGVPTVVVPVLVDQFQNADWVQSLGCGVRTEGLEVVDSDALGDAVAGVLANATIRSKAKEIADIMAKEHGVANAVERIEKAMNATMPAEPAKVTPTWVDVLSKWNTFKGFTQLPIPPQYILKGQFYSPDRSSVGWIRGGVFDVPEGQDGVGPGRYTIQAVWPGQGAVRFGNATNGGTRIDWDNGYSFVLEA